jgi:hypothetical protein
MGVNTRQAFRAQMNAVVDGDLAVLAGRAGSPRPCGPIEVVAITTMVGEARIVSTTKYRRRPGLAKGASR